MRKGHSVLWMLTLGVGAVLVLSGCPKKVETTQSTATKEERAAPAPAPEEVPAPAPKIAETPIARDTEMSGDKALADVFFDYDKYTIRPDARAGLEMAAKWLNANPGVKIKVEGHCDDRGTNEYNLTLGERRAKAVKNFLVSMGVNAGRISVISYGEERPQCNEQTEACYGKNRRAHFAR